MIEDVDLEWIEPPAELAAVFTFMYTITTHAPKPVIPFRAELPQLRFLLNDPQASVVIGMQPAQAIPPVAIFGPTSCDMVYRCPKPFRVFGLGITSYGWSQLTSIDAALAANLVLPAENLLAHDLRPHLPGLAALPSLAAMADYIKPVLVGLIGTPNPEAALFTQQVEEWLGSALSPHIDALHVMTGLSSTQVQRLCKRYYGATPVMLVRKYRALRAAVRLGARQQDRFDLIAEGFSDEGHFIREIRQFTGMTPGQILNNPDQLFTESLKRLQFTGRNEMIVSI